MSRTPQTRSLLILGRRAPHFFNHLPNKYSITQPIMRGRRTITWTLNQVEVTIPTTNQGSETSLMALGTTLIQLARRCNPLIKGCQALLAMRPKILCSVLEFQQTAHIYLCQKWVLKPVSTNSTCQSRTLTSSCNQTAYLKRLSGTCNSSHPI